MGFGVWRGERIGISGLAVVLLTCDCCGHFGNDVDDQSKRFFFLVTRKQSIYYQSSLFRLSFHFCWGGGGGLLEETVEVGCCEF